MDINKYDLCVETINDFIKLYGPSLILLYLILYIKYIILKQICNFIFF